MNKNTAINYNAAIEYALPAFREFYDMNARIKDAYKQGRGNTDLVRLMERDAQRLAAATCGEQDMIRRIYSVSEEQVHEDLMAVYTAR